MAQYKSIAVIYGSDSSEWEVSCRSGEFIASRIDEFKYDVYEILARFGKWKLVAMRKANSMRMPFPEGAQPEIDKTDFSVMVLGEKVNFDFAYIMQHGAPGETGLLQGYLEMIGIPHSTCSAFVTSVAFDKCSCKRYLQDADYVNFAPDAVIRRGDDVDAFCATVASKLGFPVFVKPTDGGSSFGITKVSKAEDLPSAIGFAFSEGRTVIVEKAISCAHELTCAVYADGSEVKALPIIEIISQTGWFDYDAKYNGLSSEVCPAQVPEELSARIQETSKRVYRHLGCKGLVRIDYIVTPEDQIYFLEVNIIPGMTNASLVPKMVRAAGMDMTYFLSKIIDNS